MEWLLLLILGGGLIEAIHDGIKGKRNNTASPSKTGYHSTPSHSTSVQTPQSNHWTEPLSGKALTPGSYWYNKRQEIFERDGFSCTQCGATVNLTVDHKTPLSLGGDNSNANLTTLCKNCHENKDQRNIFSRDFDANDNYGQDPHVSRKVRILSQALRENRTVRITYRDASGRTTQREIRPMQLLKEHGRIYIVAHCHLRQERRIFRLSRLEIG